MWGIGVMSLIAVILKLSALPMALSADSRPTPGPFTKTSTVFMPISLALRNAASVVTFAAKGVLFLDPLNPLTPVVDQATTFPCTSVTVMMGLLKVALM